jgi:hypothetical protein
LESSIFAFLGDRFVLRDASERHTVRGVVRSRRSTRKISQCATYFGASLARRTCRFLC